MSSLTRWVLSHKRLVVAFWIAMTVAGVAAAGPATRALTLEFSIPDKEGSITNAEIAKRYAGTGGEAMPLLPVISLPAGKTVESPGVRADLAKVDATLERALPGARVASYPSTGDRAFVSRDGHTVYALVYPTGADRDDFGTNTEAARKASAALRGATVGGAPVHVTGFDALAEESGGNNDGPGVARRGGDRRDRRAARAAVRVRLRAGGRPARDGGGVDHDQLRAAARADRADRGVAGRAVPDRADRARRGDRLLAAGRVALARGARARPHRRRGGAAGDGVRRPRRRVQRPHRRDRAVRAVRAAGAVPALDGLRRDADPARLDRRRHHAAPDRAVDVRDAARLAAQAHRRQGEPRLDALGRGRLAPPLDGGHRRAADDRSRWRAPRSRSSSGPPTPRRSRSPAAPRPGSRRSRTPASARAPCSRTRSSSTAGPTRRRSPRPSTGSTASTARSRPPPPTGAAMAR